MANSLSKYATQTRDQPGREKSGSAEKGAKPFLFKMPVVGENFGQTFPAHSLHRNTIDQTVTFVGTVTVELQTRAKGIPALWKHLNDGTCQQTFDTFRCFTAKRRGREKK
jgi:hypothetical protein